MFLDVFVRSAILLTIWVICSPIVIISLVAVSISSACDTAPLDISSTAVLISPAATLDCEAIESIELPDSPRSVADFARLPTISLNLIIRVSRALPMSPISSCLLSTVLSTSTVRSPPATFVTDTLALLIDFEILCAINVATIPTNISTTAETISIVPTFCII